MNKPPDLLSLPRPAFLDAMGAAHAPLHAAAKVAGYSDEDALRLFIASHPAPRLRGWADEMGGVADVLQQAAATARRAQAQLARVLR